MFFVLVFRWGLGSRSGVYLVFSFKFVGFVMVLG